MNAYLPKISFVALLFAEFIGSAAFSLGTAGPYVAAEIAQKSTIRDEKSGADLDMTMSKRKETLSLVAPAGQWLGGKWAVKFKQIHETREYDGTAVSKSQKDGFGDIGANTFTLIYASEAMIPKAKVYLVAGRHGRRDLTHDTRPMGEYYGAINFRLADLGLNILPAPSDETSLIMRVRNWSYGNDYLPILNQEISLGEGFKLDIGIVSHATISWDSPGDVWGVYASVDGNSQTTPVQISGDSLWVQGSTLDAFIGIRRHVASIVHTSVEGGLHQDHSVIKDGSGETIADQKAEFAPWARLRVETYIP